MIGGADCFLIMLHDKNRVAEITKTPQRAEQALVVALVQPDRWFIQDIQRVAAVHALNWNSTIPQGKVHVTVDKGWITLRGDVEWQFQRQLYDALHDYLVEMFIRTPQDRVERRERGL